MITSIFFVISWNRTLIYDSQLCYLTEEAMFLWKKNRNISVRVLSVVWNVEECDFKLASGYVCALDFQLFKPL